MPTDGPSPDSTKADTPNVEAVASAMEALGSAWRGDWSDFDGRTLRSELGDLASHLRSDTPVTYEQLCREVGVCPVRRAWPEYCDEKPEGRWATCVHMM
jgi:hypothetical protein